MEEILEKTAGFTGADIKTLMNEAAFLAIRAHRDIILKEDIDEAIRRIIIGSQSTRENFAKNKYNTAVHEAGHVITAILQGEDIMEVSIIPRGDAAGYTLNNFDTKKVITVDEIVKRIKIVLGGRAAEKIVFGKVSAGASF